MSFAFHREIASTPRLTEPFHLDLSRHTPSSNAKVPILGYDGQRRKFGPRGPSTLLSQLFHSSSNRISSAGAPLSNSSFSSLPAPRPVSPALMNDPAFSLDPYSNPDFVGSHNSSWYRPAAGYPSLKTDPKWGRIRSQPLPMSSRPGMAESSDEYQPLQPPNTPISPDGPHESGQSFPFPSPSSSGSSAASSTPPSSRDSLESLESTSVEMPKTPTDSLLPPLSVKEKKINFFTIRKPLPPTSAPLPPSSALGHHDEPSQGRRVESNETHDVNKTLRPIPIRNASAPELRHQPEAEILTLLPRPATTPTDLRFVFANNIRPPISAHRSSHGRHLPRVHELDRIDELDETDPSGVAVHHGGPYEAIHIPAKKTVASLSGGPNIGAQYQSQEYSARGPLQGISTKLYDPMSGAMGFSLNLSPGQILPPNMIPGYNSQLPQRIYPPVSDVNNHSNIFSLRNPQQPRYTVDSSRDTPFPQHQQPPTSRDASSFPQRHQQFPYSNHGILFPQNQQPLNSSRALPLPQHQQPPPRKLPSPWSPQQQNFDSCVPYVPFSPDPVPDPSVSLQHQPQYQQTQQHAQQQRQQLRTQDRPPPSQQQPLERLAKSHQRHPSGNDSSIRPIPSNREQRLHLQEILSSNHHGLSQRFHSPSEKSQVTPISEPHQLFEEAQPVIPSTEPPVYDNNSEAYGGLDHRLINTHAYSVRTHHSAQPSSEHLERQRVSERVDHVNREANKHQRIESDHRYKTSHDYKNYGTSSSLSYDELNTQQQQQKVQAAERERLEQLKHSRPQNTAQYMIKTEAVGLQQPNRGTQQSSQSPPNQSNRGNDDGNGSVHSHLQPQHQLLPSNDRRSEQHSIAGGSSRTGLSAKPLLPHYLPKRLVMPTPLQPPQPGPQAAPTHVHYQPRPQPQPRVSLQSSRSHSHIGDQDYDPYLHVNSPPLAQAQVRAQDIPIADGQSRKLLRKRASMSNPKPPIPNGGRAAPLVATNLPSRPQSESKPLENGPEKPPRRVLSKRR